MKVSTFSDYYSTQPVERSLQEVAESLRSDPALRDLTLSYRTTRIQQVKERSPLFAVACRFNGGKGNADITGLTGLSLVDIDHAGDTAQVEALRQKAEADPHTLLCYVTVSGEGLRIIYRYELDTALALDRQKQSYRRAFELGNAYYARLLGTQTDAKCKNLTRLSGLAYDPAVCYRPQAEPFTAAWMDEQTNLRTRDEKARRKHQRELARIRRHYEDCIRPEVEAEGAVYAPGSHNDYVMRVGYRLNQFGFSPDAATEWACAEFPDYEGTASVIAACFRRTEEHGTRRLRQRKQQQKEESYFATADEIRSFLDSRVRLRFNELTRRTEICTISDDGKAASAFEPVTDRKVNTLWAEMASGRNVRISDLYHVIESDYATPWHPLVAYLDSLPEWNAATCPDYLRQLSATITVKTDAAHREEMQELFHTYLTKWMVGMIAAWKDERVVNNVILVLIGHQGAYKTTWLNLLLPPELQKYFYTKTDASRLTKDDRITLAQYALVCYEELDSMRPFEMSQLKAMVTAPHINERAAYAHFHEHRKHIASFCGTGNSVQFLTDPTGTRRWLPVEVEHIVSPREQPFNYTGIYSQALALYRSGFRYWFTPDDIRRLTDHNRKFETPCLEKELALLYFRLPMKQELGEFMSVARALQVIGTGITQKLSAVQLGRALKELGFRQVKYKNVRGYIVKQRTALEIQDALTSMALNSETD